MKLARRLFLALCAAALLQASLSSDEKLLSAAISAAELRAHVSFLASDALEGRDTPSKGLDAAAEYIASEFRRAGLEPAGDSGYFQTAPYALVQQDLTGFQFAIAKDGERVAAPAKSVRVVAEGECDLKDVAVVKISMSAMAPPAGSAADEAIDPARWTGKVVLLERTDFGAIPSDKWSEAYGRMLRIRERVLDSKAVLVVESVSNLGREGARLVDLSGRHQTPPPTVSIRDEAFRELAKKLPEGDTGARVTVHLAASEILKTTLKNVAGLLRGSDPQLRDTYVIVSGHYDHEGVQGGEIFNGANDDASGTATMLTLAETIAGLPHRPKRSLLFLAYFGEEKGLLGSRYYGAHPIYPLAKTVLNVNLEQMGRTDDSEGPNLKRLFVTGYDYTNLLDWLEPAARDTGVGIVKHERNSDAFFGRADNQALADAGVPAHTLCTAFMYPDYHQPGDHWEKIDYDNMAAVTRSVGVAVLRVANSSRRVEWSDDNPRAAKYRKAGQALAPAR